MQNCTFCGASPTNREHVFSAWSHRYLTKKPGKWDGVVAVQSIEGSAESQRLRGVAIFTTEMENPEEEEDDIG
jgi:hypothetical protein